MARTTNVREERIELTAVDKSLSSSMNTAQRSVGALRSQLDTLRNAAAAFGATAGIGGLALFARSVVNATKEAEQASNRLNAVLRLSGQAAGVTRRELDELADAMQGALGFDDEAIRNGQAELLKFGNIHGQVFMDALKAIADYAAFTGDDFASAAQTLGKALQSPAEGAGMLERQIGKLTAAEEAQIKSLMEHNRLADAQGVILDVVRRKIGGTAQEMNTGLLNSTRDVANAWDDMLKAIGRTDLAQRTAQSSLGFIAQSLKDIQQIVERGDWVEKTLALLAFAGGWRDFKLSRPPQTPSAASSGGGPISFEKAIEGFPLTDVNFEVWKKEFDRLKRERETEAKRRAEAAKREQDTVSAELARSLQAQQDIFDEASVFGVQFLREQDQKRERLRQQADLYRDLIDPMQKYHRELEKIAKLERMGAALGGLTETEAAMARANVYKRLDDEMFKHKEVTDEITEFWKAAAQNMQGAMSSFFFDIMQGNLRDLAGNFKRTIDQMVSNILAAKAQTALFGKGFGQEGVPMGGLVGGLFDRLFGGTLGAIGRGAGAGALETLGVGLPMFQHGGEFTVGGSGGADSQLVAFRASPEEIVTVETPAQRRRDREGKNKTVNVSMVVNTPDANSFRRSKSQIEADLAMMMQRGLRNL